MSLMANPSLYAYMLNGKSDFTFVRPLSPNLRVAVSTALAAGVAGGTSHWNHVAHVCHALAVLDRSLPHCFWTFSLCLSALETEEEDVESIPAPGMTSTGKVSCYFWLSLSTLLSTLITDNTLGWSGQ